jgi:phosphatidylglycerol---prolipoprotein diacylglyceryl transferase
VLLGGRALVVINNEWPFYREHLSLIPAIWVGGFATHGLIFGGAAGVLLFCVIYKVEFRPIFDLLAISAAIILAFGRIGNFIDGQIFGSLADVPWAVKFPNVEGFRHPVVLYDGLKNFLLVPILLLLRKLGLPPGRLAAIFVILYAGLRIPIDLLREYPISTLGLPTGQTLNIITVFVGFILLGINVLRSDRSENSVVVPSEANRSSTRLRRVAFALCCTVPLVIPSDATRDIPATYGSRHPELAHSAMYPAIADDLRRAAEEEK